MGLYITAEEAIIRLSRYSGLTIPSTEPTSDNGPSLMDILIEEAESYLEEFIGYRWGLQEFTNRISLFRDGQGQIPDINSIYTPLQEITEVSTPINSLYSGPAYTKDDLQWNAMGQIFLGYANQPTSPWINPIAASPARVMSDSLFPTELEITYKVGRTDHPPTIFKTVIVPVLAILTINQEDTDMLVSTQILIRELGLRTDNFYKDDAIAAALRPVERYKK